MMMQRLGVDTGGTFTDFVFFDGTALHTCKVLSTPPAPAQAIMQGIAELGLSRAKLHVVHGSTVATNAVLEGKLAKTAYITNKGLRDTLSIGRQARRELYNLQPSPLPPPLPTAHCFEIDCRIGADGEVLRAPTDDDIERLRSQIAALQPEAVAVNLLFSFIDDRHEKRIADSLSEDMFVTRSSSLLPVYREYERGIVTWLNAAVGPLMKKYLKRLAQDIAPATLTLMQSSGDVIDAQQAMMTPASLLLSGPAGGLMGAKAMAEAAGFRRLITFDMGGTSSDVALLDGAIALTSEGRIADYPVSLPMVDMHTIGAGGGSLAYVDEGGMLQVGPQSAGAAPGPACYGRGGEQATVTDANVVLGYLPARTALAGAMPLDEAAAVAAMRAVAKRMDCSVAQAAQGVLSVANECMARALRVISVEKGHDPRAFTLVSFGGAGGLHACDLAETLGMRSVFVPMHAGVLSALGMLFAPQGRRMMRTYIRPFATVNVRQVEDVLRQMQEAGRQALLAEGVAQEQIQCQREADVRYIGQSSTLRLSWGQLEEVAALFQAQHARRFGHALSEPLELVNLHVSVQAVTPPPVLPTISTADAAPVAEQEIYALDAPAPVFERLSLGAGQTLRGPALLVEPCATTWVKTGWTVKVDAYGNLLLTRMEGGIQ